jgi:hypothetical protein
MKNARLAGAIALCGIGLIMIGLGSFVATPNAMATATDDFSSTSESRRDISKPESPQRLGVGDCYAPGAPVTWSVFEPVARPLELVRGSDLISCFSADDNLIDFDGDGELELSNSSGSNPGVRWFGSQIDYTPFSVLRSTEDGIALEIVLEFPVDIQYWLGLVGWQSSDDFNVSIYSFLDVDRDGLLDALIRVRGNGLDGNGVSQSIYRYFWYRNQLTPPGDRIAGDVNNDGLVDGADLTIVLSDWTG